MKITWKKWAAIIFLISIILIFTVLFFANGDPVTVWKEKNASAGWPARLWHAGVATPDGTIIVMGGQANFIGITNDIWSSTDQGRNWSQVTSYAEWPKRTAHCSVAIQDESIVIMGGRSSEGSLMNDVWRSVDHGATWVQETAHAGWSPREFHTCATLPDGSIVVMGGSVDNSGGTEHDVWLSTDKGRSWTMITAEAGWPPRGRPTSAVLPDGSILAMGGVDAEIHHGAVYYNDVWRSEDKGATWKQMTGNASWSPRWGQTSVALPDGSILLMGGYDRIQRNDTWRSTDKGATWTLLNQSSGWSPRVYFSTVVLPDGTVVLMGGDSGSIGQTNDVWTLEPSPSLWKLFNKMFAG